MTWRLGLVLAVAVLACAVPAGPAWGASFGVNSTNDETDADPGDGFCASFAFNCTLRAAIQEANAVPGADGIDVPAGTYELAIGPLNQNDITTGDLDITEAVTITGTGAGSSIVDGGVPKAGSSTEVVGLDRLFEVQAPNGTVSLSGLTIRNGYAEEYGGALFNGGDATVTLTNSTVTGNFAAKAGGGIDNHAGGAVHVTASDISANEANQSGSALNNNRGGTLTVIDSTISKNGASAFGRDPSLFGAGAIGNNAELDERGTVTVSGSSLFDNAAGGSNPGAAISNDGRGTVEVSGSTIYKNTSQTNGGGIFTGGGEVTVLDSTLTENVAEGGGAIYYGSINGGRTVVERSTISLNHARAEGGGVSSNGLGDLRLTDVTLAKNSADDWGGAVMHNDQGGVAVVRGSFSENSGLSGGGLANEGAGVVTVEDSSFSKNTAREMGGGIHTNSVGEVSVTGGSFNENKALDGGGLSNEGGGKVAVTGTSFSRNTAEQEGGGILVQAGNVIMKDLAVLDNVAGSAETGGGGISHQGDRSVSGNESVHLQTSLVKGNRAGQAGGGIDSRGDGGLVIATTTIESNTAKVGGGLNHDGDAPLDIGRTTLARNSSEHGGGLATDGDGEATVENSTISGNTASQFGGGMLVRSRLVSRSTTVTQNSSPVGAGISNGAGDFTDDGLVFLRNTIVAGNSGGPNCAGAVTSQGGNIDSADTCGLEELSDQPATDPRLGPLAANGGPTPTHALLAGSPAQDVAVHTETDPCPPVDQRGVARPHGAGCDVGAFESELAPEPPPPDVSCAARVERVVQADADSWVEQGSPGNNFGDDSILKVRSQRLSNSRALVHFALPAPPAGCSLAGAKLRLYAASATTRRTLGARRIASAWSESGVTWTNQPATTGETATAASRLGYVEWNVTAHVEAMYAGGNNGFLVRDTAENGRGEQSFHSREKGAEGRPELVITFDG